MELNIYTLKLILVVLMGLAISEGFLPNNIRGDIESGYSHSDITYFGIRDAIQAYLHDNKIVTSNPNAIDVYFGSDNDAKKSFYSIIDNIKSANNGLQKFGSKQAKYSVNGEQIQEAHFFIIQTKKEIQALLNGTLTEPVLTLIREKIGQCLFVIQSFYSHTSWVEKHGSKDYHDFGVEGATLIQTASRETPTCSSCDDSHPSSCKDNILEGDWLTSGYHSGQDIQKVLFEGAMTGKCSHGGQQDKSRTKTATGGINKDTTHSPHGHLHYSAADAARKATIKFLTHNVTGILALTDHKRFSRIFNLQRRVSSSKSLAFSIDTTGSMGDDIAAVRSNVINMTLSVMGSHNQPDNYVLATFNDPATKTQGCKTTDGNELIKKVNALVATGGGDCPEYSMSGIMKAIELANNGSSIMHFTDADAKDCDRYTETKQAALAKNISINSFISGNCGTSRCQARFQRDVDGVTGVGDSIYQNLASATGGAVYNVHKAEIKSVLRAVIQKEFPSSKVVVNEFDLPTSAGNTTHVLADADMEVLTIDIFGADRGDVTLIDPRGSEHLKSDGNVSIFAESSRVVFSAKHPIAGNWTMERKTMKPWKVNIAAEAGIDVLFNLIDTDTNGLSYYVTDNPIAGENYTLEIKLMNLQMPPESVEVSLLGTNKITLQRYTTNISNRTTGNQTNLDILMPQSPFKIQISCEYKTESLSFIRLSKKTILPVSVQLSLDPILGELSIGEQHNMSYSIQNKGQDTETFKVQLKVDGEEHTACHDHELASGEIHRKVFTINGTRSPGPLTYSVSVRKANKVLQTRANTIVFTRVLHPKCTVLKKFGNCSAVNETVRCNTVEWSAMTEIKFSGVSLQKIFISNGNADVNITHKDISIATNKLNVSLSGTCCTPSIRLNALDTASYLGSCELIFGDPEIVQRQSVVIVESIDKNDGVLLKIGFLAGVITGCVILIGILIICIACKYNKHKAKRKDKC